MMLLAGVARQDAAGVNAIQLNRQTSQTSQISMNNIHMLLQAKSSLTKEKAGEMLQQVKAVVDAADLGQIAKEKDAKKDGDDEKRKEIEKALDVYKTLDDVY